MQPDITSTLPAIGFNFAELKAWAEGITEQYAGLVVREEDIAGIKSEMAGLNKLKKQLDDARKATVRQVSEPIKDFESQIKEVCGIFDATYQALGSQVQAFEDTAREQKRRDIQFLIDATLDEYGVKDFFIDIPDRWTNKTAKTRTVKAEIESIILAHLKTEREAAQLEQAKKDRAVSIEQTCAALARGHGFTLPPSQFLSLQDLSIPLAEVNARIERAYTTRAMAAEHSAPAPRATPRIQAPSAPQRPVTITVEVQYLPDQERAVETALRNLQAVCLSASIINPAQAA